jgi:hypothetical protein
LRENLGLPYPENRWAQSARVPQAESVAAS